MAVTIPFPHRPEKKPILKRQPADILQELAAKAPADFMALAMIAQALLEQMNS